MNTDHSEDVRIFLRQRDRATAAFDRRADRDNAGDPGFGRTAQDVFEVGREIRIIEMGVSFDEHSLIVGRF